MLGIIVLRVFYGSAVFCAIASIKVMLEYINAPIHLHWELYRESSVYELSDWQTKTHSTLIDKLKYAILNILFLREYYQRNRSFWYFLYLFHVGLYLLILWHAWFLIGVKMINIEIGPTWGLLWGHIATGLTFIGSVGIIIKRMTEENLNIYYPPVHYLKWLLIILTLLEGFYSVQFYFGTAFESLLLDFHPNAATSTHLLFASVWLVYLPFSHIMKLFFRYYHHFRWDDKPNLRGSDMEKRIEKLLDKPVSWSASHIQTGKKWSEVATELPGHMTKTEKK